MKSQPTQPGASQGDWDRERNDIDPRTGASNPDYGRSAQRSAPENYPESRYQYQAQQDHPGVEYFSGSTGYGGRGEYNPQQQGQGGFGQQQGPSGSPQQPGYGGGSWSRSDSEFRGQGANRQQEAFQPGARQHRQSQDSQFGRGDFEEQPFAPGSRQQGAGWGEQAQWSNEPGHARGIREYRSDQGHIGQPGSLGHGGRQENPFQGGQFQDSRMIDRQAEQFGQSFGHQQNQSMDSPRGQEFHGYGGRMSGQSHAGQSSQFGGHYAERQGGQQSQGYGGFQSGQPNDYGNQQQGQFMGHGGHSAVQQPSGGYGSYGAYQVGSQPQHMGRSPRPPKDYARSDDRLRELICEHLAHHHSIDASEVSIQVKEGRVTLEGTVPDRRMKHEIEDVADGCWGVKDVDNRIRVQSQSPAGGQQRSGQSNLDNPAQGWLAVPSDILTGGASTEAATGVRTSPTEMSATETSGSGMPSAGTGGSATTIASGRDPAGAEAKMKDKDK